MSTDQPRKPAGTPVGAHWPPTAHAEADISLATQPAQPSAGGWVPAKILDVVDTRTYEEGPDDRWHPVPGSGTVNQCDRCGKDHEVHVVVEDQDGKEQVVGTSCAHATGPLAKRMASAVSAAQKLKALKEQLVLAEEYQAKRAAAAQVLEPQFPGWDEAPAPNLTGTGGPKRVIWTTKDGLAKVWVTVRRDEDKPEWESQRDWDRRRQEEHDERERCLRDAWLRDRLSQKVGDPPKTPDVATLRDEIAKTEARLAALRDKAGNEHLPLEQAAGGTVKRSGKDPRTKKAIYTEADLAPHLGKTVTIAPASGKTMHSTQRYYSGPVTGTLHSVWKDRDGNVLGFRLARTRTVVRDNQPVEVTEIEEFGSRSHGSLTAG